MTVNSSAMTISPAQFITKWKASKLTERSGSQTHFNDLCYMLGEAPPSAADQDGSSYCFDRGVNKLGGGKGWADVWKRQHFGWEYKSKGKDLDDALVQLQRYALALENPPLLVVCDMERFRIHTNWTNTVSQTIELTLDDLHDPKALQNLRWVLAAPEKLKPGLTREALTRDAAQRFAGLAADLRARGHEAGAVAHFINRLVFCMFAEDAGLLSNHLFSRMLEVAKGNPTRFLPMVRELFGAMKSGGMAGWEEVPWFNGGLFDSDSAIPLSASEITQVFEAAELDWSEMDPALFGTLFEGGLDPDKRSQLGAHYTDGDKIRMIVEPVVVQPLLAEWEIEKTRISSIMENLHKSKSLSSRNKYAKEARNIFREFLERLWTFRVLDPACGSGNFLYISLLALKDIEHRISIEAEAMGLQREFPRVGPEAVLGIEINPFAAELARVSVWIGEIQWMQRNGFGVSRNPILRSLHTIECRDAVIDNGLVAAWPKADVIIGNPPFLGAKLMKRRLGVAYTDELRSVYKERLAGFSDLVCYWFERAREQVLAGKAHRAGLVATSSICGGTNRPVLDKISTDLEIYNAWSKQPWTIEGARVEVSLICFQAKTNNKPIFLDGSQVLAINSDLTTGVNLTKAKPQIHNSGVSFLGIQKSGPHDVNGEIARAWMKLPSNPNKIFNHEVLKPYKNGDDLTSRNRDRWIIDFPINCDEFSISLFEDIYKYLLNSKYDPESLKDTRGLVEARQESRDRHARDRWWEPYWPRPEMRARIQTLPRYIVTTETSEHRIFIWLKYPVLPDKNLIVIARDDDTTFGILHSRFHELWALRLGTSLEDRPRYTSTTTFSTYPFPDGLTPDLPAYAYSVDSRAQEIAKASKLLNDLRESWLNPSELVERVPEEVPGFPDRLIPRDDKAAAILKKRTLTNLYNERPAWLANAHRQLDEAVAAAYGWPADLSDEDVLSRLLALNIARSSPAGMEVAIAGREMEMA
ncbi:class I SAM-dependent DNA methyltransferase [Azospirillum himalayense]|uniref:site-specific DNA-methyltransferase (adenine-specific) n=1 Tax=Azospirillum himalayense TaxID=654847 RepID=A0ABW0GEQ1_9PROT